MGMSKQEAGRLGACALKTKLFFEKLIRKQKYDENPVICKQCKNPHDYKRRKNKFCSSSCSATFNNLLRGKKQYKCKNCDSVIKTEAKKYCCNWCQMQFQMKEAIFNKTASAGTSKKFLIDKHGNKCWTCGITEWNNKKIVMELEHIDGNSENNDLENLSIICPNCHSQTPTYKARNKGKGRHYRRIRYREGKSF